jgi:hypothetical protein
MHSYEKKYGVKPQMLVYILASVDSVTAQESMTVDLDCEDDAIVLF